MLDPKHEIVATGGEMSDLDKILAIAQTNTMSINSINRALAGLQVGFDDHEGRINALEAYKLKSEQQKRVNRSEADELRRAISKRVSYLLHIDTSDGMVADDQIDFEQRYRPGFIARCYTDARHHSRLGTPYYETLHKDYDEVLEYINAWEPEVKGGKEGYMRYLDIRRESRSKGNA